MKHKRKHLPILFTILFGTIFLSLLFTRMGIFDSRPARTEIADISSSEIVADRDTWMNIFQDKKKIGFSHSRYARLDQGYRFNETLFMRINTMGMVQDIGLNTSGILNTDFSLKSFDFKIASGRFNFSAAGNITDKTLKLNTQSSGAKQTYQLNLADDIYFTSGIVQAASAGKLKPGDQLTLKVFDPIAMGQESILLRILEEEDITIMGQVKKATKISLKFKGATQLAWMDEKGDLLREKGMLGIILEKTSREDAMHGLPIQSSQDLTKAASIPANIDIDNPDELMQIRFEITGSGDFSKQLQGGRQTYNSPVLSIQKESLDDLPQQNPPLVPTENITTFLGPSPFIQSDNPAIQRLTSDLVAEKDPALEKARKLVAWMQAHIEKRPVISLPDALSTLENRVGDCNEHAVLFAALARSAGIPTRIEAGVVFLRKRFFYHAWNSIYVGRWITVDALFDQIPADVTHIRLAGGMQKDQLDILGLIGNLKIKILNGTSAHDRT
ncbi:transglutaminase family protein [Thermodesulfobacteriota bacterium]